MEVKDVSLGSIGMSIWLVGALLGLLPQPATGQERDSSRVSYELLEAIATKQTATASRLLEANTNVVRADASASRKLLHQATEAGNVALMKRLLELGAKIDAQGETLSTGNSQSTALHVAVRHRQREALMLLLEAGANPNLMAFGFVTPLHQAITQRSEDLADELLDYGANPFQAKRFTNDKTTPLELAITHGRGRLAARMLGLDPQRPVGGKACSPALPKDREAVYRSAAVTLLTEHGGRLLCRAAQQGAIEAVEALLNAGVPATNEPPVLRELAVAQAGRDRTPGFDVSRWSQLRARLIKAGATDDVFAATARGEADRVRTLLAAGTNLAAATDHEGGTPLHWAVRTERPALVSLWIEMGVPLEATNSAGQTALHLAAEAGLAESAALLLAARAPISTRDTNGSTPMDVAVREQQTEVIRLLLGSQPAGTPSERGIATPLHAAAENGDTNAVDKLLGAGTALEARDELGRTPLHLAVRSGHLDAALLLLQAGADLRATDPEGNTLLHQIILDRPRMVAEAAMPSEWLAEVRSKSDKRAYLKYLSSRPDGVPSDPVLQVAAFLLASGLSPQLTNRAGFTPAQLAADEEAMQHAYMDPEEKTVLLQLLRLGGGRLDQGDANGDTPLHRAAQTYSPEHVTSLIAAGANVNATNLQGRTPLHKFAEEIHMWSADDGTNSPFQVLLQAKPNVNVQDRDGLTPLHVLALAETSFKQEATKALLEAGANPNLRDKLGRTPAQCLLSGAWPWAEAGECLALLRKAGADLALKDQQDRTALHQLAAIGDDKPLSFIHGLDQWLDQTKLDPNARDAEGNTPLHLAAKTGAGDVFKWLVAHGAKLDATNHDGKTPRQLAARSTNEFADFRHSPDTDPWQAARMGNVESLKALLDGDPALLNGTERGDQTPLRAAVTARRTNVIEYLDRKGVKWDAVSAVLAGRPDKLLGVLTAEPTAITNTLRGSGLIHLAVAGGHLDLIRVLLERKCDVSARDSRGLSPLGLAELLGRPNGGADLLRQHGAKLNIFDAVFRGDRPAAERLLAEDRSLAQTANSAGMTVIEVAAGMDRAGLIPLLLSHGASVTATNRSNGRTPLHAAATFECTNAASLLLAQQADVNARDIYGFTPLHLAGIRGSRAVAARLLAARADPDAHTAPGRPGLLGSLMDESDLGGATALHWAVLCGHTNIVQLLLDSGAAINASTTHGRTPLDLATAAISHWSQNSATEYYRLDGLSDPNLMRTFDSANELLSLRSRVRSAAEILKSRGAERGSPRRW